MINGVKGNEYLIAQPRKFNFHGCTCLINKKMFNVVGGLDESLRILNDVDWWFRMYSNGVKLNYVPEVLVKGRIHAAQVGRSIGYSSNNLESDMLWRRRLDWLIKYHPDNVELYTLLGRDAYLSSRPRDGKKAFAYAMKNSPSKRIILIFQSVFLNIVAWLRRNAKCIYIKMKL